MRGAHRGVWCSKRTHLMEAELFAAPNKRPAPDGRALLCAADNAREIQGITASQNLPDARNRAPVTPVSPRNRRASRRKGGFGGVKRGQGNHMVPLPPFVSAARRRHSRRETPAFPAAAGGHSSRPKTGHFSPPAAHRCIGGTACPLLREKEGHSPPCGEISCTARQDLI